MERSGSPPSLSRGSKRGKLKGRRWHRGVVHRITSRHTAKSAWRPRPIGRSASESPSKLNFAEGRECEITPTYSSGIPVFVTLGTVPKCVARNPTLRGVGQDTENV